MYKKIAQLVISMSFVGFGCASVPDDSGNTMVQRYVSEDSVFLEETTVVEVNGYSVGSGNYFLRQQEGQEERMSIALSIWKEEWPDDATIHQTVFLGDVVEIGNKRYTLVLVEGRKDQVLDALLVRVE